MPHLLHGVVIFKVQFGASRSGRVSGLMFVGCIAEWKMLTCLPPYLQQSAFRALGHSENSQQAYENAKSETKMDETK